MERLAGILHRLVRSNEGQDLLEYAMLAALIAVVAVTAVGTLGQTINAAFWELIARSSI